MFSYDCPPQPPQHFYLLLSAKLLTKQFYRLECEYKMHFSCDRFLYLNASLDLNRHRLIAQKMDWASCLSRAHCLTIDVNKNGSRHAIFPDSKFFIFVGLRSACANPPNALKSPAFGGRLRSTLNLDETNFRYNNFDYFHWRRIVLFLSIPHSPITIPIPLDANLISDRKIAKG